jgi:hypothetical protein
MHIHLQGEQEFTHTKKVIYPRKVQFYNFGCVFSKI